MNSLMHNRLDKWLSSGQDIIIFDTETTGLKSGPLVMGDTPVTINGKNYELQEICRNKVLLNRILDYMPTVEAKMKDLLNQIKLGIGSRDEYESTAEMFNTMEAVKEYSAVCHVIQISAIKAAMVNGELVEKERFNTYINPGYPLPEKIVEITGITDELLKTAPTEKEVFGRILDFFGENPCIAAYNSGFDIGFMKCMYFRNGKTFDPQVDLDILLMSKEILGHKTKDHKLHSCVEHYGVGDDLTFHNSMDDTVATLRLLRLYIKEYNKGKLSDREVNFEVLFCNYWEKEMEGRTGNFWLKRVYVTTSLGKVFLDVKTYKWGESADNKGLLKRIDNEVLEHKAFQKLLCDNYSDFVKNARERKAS